MILGHWYLVLPSMDVSLLQSIVKFHIGSTVLRIVVVGTVGAAGGREWGGVDGAKLRALHLLARWGVLLAAGAVRVVWPAVLAYLTWRLRRSDRRSRLPESSMSISLL